MVACTLQHGDGYLYPFGENMTRTIVAILALSPAVLFAQASTPAQPSSTPVLQSSLLAPAAFAVKSENGSANSGPLRISSGVTGPKLLHKVNLASDLNARVTSKAQVVVLELTIDPTGVPQNLKVVASTDHDANEKIVAAVSQYRYKPGTLNGEPTSFPLRLEVTVPAGTAY
jgi:hypothetical protein